MMGRQSRQMAMLFVDIESLIPETHLLRKIERMVSFNFIYDLLAPYYPATGRPSVDPVSMFKMLLIGYLYGIKSERRLVEEVQLNIAYRWFCGFELDDTIPNHSTFSKTRTRKWQQSDLFQKAFYEIVKQCIDSGLIDGEAMAADGSYIPANVSRESWINVEIEVEQSMQSYLDSLDEELSNQPGFKKPPTEIVRKCRTTSQTDPDSGYINHGSKRGIGYLMEATVDCKHGILTGVDVYPANEKESLLVLRHLERQINLGIPMSRLALDRGYETGAVHRGLELLGITGYIPAIQFSNPPEKYGFSYDPQLDAFICPEGVPLTYHRLNCSKSTGKYLRCYQVEGDACMRCPKRPSCFDKAGIRRRVLASSCYPAFFRGHQRVGTPEYLAMMRLRKIWAEGSFSVLKREHCISRIRKRGILAATEECLLAAMALNLKRMVNTIFRYLQIYCSAGTTVGSSRIFAFVNRSNYYICYVTLENFNLSHLPVYIMGEETLSRYALYMATLGNRPDLFPSSPYVGKYTNKPPAHEIPEDYLADETFAAILKEAEKYVGYPYVWGGSSPSTSFDCSSFVSYVYNQCGWDFGRLGAQGLYNISTRTSSPKPGDLVFFTGTYDTPGISHVGIYVGDGWMLHCGDPISYANLNTSYWQSHFYAYGKLF